MAQYQIDNVAAPIDFQGTDSRKRLLQNAKNLLMLRMGELPYDRSRGFDSSLYHLPIEKFKQELMPELDRLMMWEPSVRVIKAEASLTGASGTYIKVTIDMAE